MQPPHQYTVPGPSLVNGLAGVQDYTIRIYTSQHVRPCRIPHYSSKTLSFTMARNTKNPYHPIKLHFYMYYSRIHGSFIIKLLCDSYPTISSHWWLSGLVPTRNLSGLSAMLMAECSQGSHSAIASLLAWHRLSSKSIYGTTDGHAETWCPFRCTSGFVLQARSSAAKYH